MMDGNSRTIMDPPLAAAPYSARILGGKREGSLAAGGALNDPGVPGAPSGRKVAKIPTEIGANFVKENAFWGPEKYKNMISKSPKTSSN